MRTQTKVTLFQVVLFEEQKRLCINCAVSYKGLHCFHFTTVS